jgi:hypothetical protein
MLIMNTRKILSLTMLALVTACSAADDSTPEPHDGEPPRAEPTEAAANVDSVIPSVSRAEVLDLQHAALALPMPSVASASGHALAYDEIMGGHLSARSVDLCELAYLYDGGAGRYRVRDIVGVSETIEVGGTTHPAAFTYIQLELEQDWSGFAPQNPVLRVRGGPLDHAQTQSWDIGLERDEVIGLFLWSPLEGQNKGYYRTDALGVFRLKPDGGFTNGQLFKDEVASLDELGRLSQALYQALPQVIHRPPWRRLLVPRDLCAHDVQPDAYRHDIDLDALRQIKPQPEEIELDHSPH